MRYQQLSVLGRPAWPQHLLLNMRLLLLDPCLMFLNHRIDNRTYLTLNAFFAQYAVVRKIVEIGEAFGIGRLFTGCEDR